MCEILFAVFNNVGNLKSGHECYLQFTRAWRRQIYTLALFLLNVGRLNKHHSWILILNPTGIPTQIFMITSYNQIAFIIILPQQPSHGTSNNFKYGIIALFYVVDLIVTVFIKYLFLFLDTYTLVKLFIIVNCVPFYLWALSLLLSIHMLLQYRYLLFSSCIVNLFINEFFTSFITFIMVCKYYT